MIDSHGVIVIWLENPRAADFGAAGSRPGPDRRKRKDLHDGHGTGAELGLKRQLDPITFRVLGGAFEAVAQEMASVQIRMSISGIIRESEDIGAGIFDLTGREICESDTSPMHIGSLPWYIRGIRQTSGDDWSDGDVVLHNHPYKGASHSPDAAIIMPIFFEGEAVAFAAVTAHMLDVGGASPG